ncbi:SDR family NAD(P)-dependent oxidoreductase [Paraconexibacter antarcticus]|uniref:SDR family NAD(P)-dependent oxidoreductase n=1 Tax=Paraconexibacter antarcticus TaxID=2949664 RepID=A0ABY5DW46_9ACTN|nr:SDR family NAD(P)-dependent oxidoreductase [Paraconexibacter antarcticus]UTI65311.1 SDR family NAD(P)-dependent oxidoreductase [Paraconexibacter antarcticus]
MGRQLDLSARTVLITGAAGGLGSALAQALRERGAYLALLDLDADALAAQADALGGADVARGWAADVTDLAYLERVMAEVRAHFGGIDVAVAGAGVLGPVKTMTATSAAEWDRVIDINLGGVWRALRAAAPHVAARQGHLVALSSLIAYVHPPLLGGYAASKAAVAALCDVLRLELRPAGVTVGSVHPAIFRTPLIAGGLDSPAAVALVRDFTGVFRTVELDAVVADVVRAIEHRSARLTVPRAHRATPFAAGAVQAVVERLAFRPRTVRRAIALGSITTATESR